MVEEREIQRQTGVIKKTKQIFEFMGPKHITFSLLRFMWESKNKYSLQREVKGIWSSIQ